LDGGRSKEALQKKEQIGIHSLEAVANSPTSNPNPVLKSTSYGLLLGVCMISYFEVDYMGIIFVNGRASTDQPQ
jgi:hypothetical protein